MTINIQAKYRPLSQEEVEELMYQLEGEVSYEQKMVGDRPENWTKEYHEGFIDGLKRAVEIAKEEI